LEGLSFANDENKNFEEKEETQTNLMYVRLILTAALSMAKGQSFPF